MTVTETAPHISTLHNRAVELMPTENAYPPPVVELRLPRVVRQPGGPAHTRPDRVVRVQRLREPYSDGKFKAQPEINGSTLQAILANPEAMLSQLRPESLAEAVCAYVNKTNLPAKFLQDATALLWYLIAAQAGATLSVRNIGAVTTGKA